MSKPYTPKVVTANALIEGDVIYLGADDQWTRDLAQAEIITDEAHAQLRLLHAEMQSSAIVGAYLAEVVPTKSGAAPTHFREEFRATGPSNYAHGKQAEQANV